MNFIELQGRCVRFFIAMKGIYDTFIFNSVSTSKLATLTSYYSAIDWNGIFSGAYLLNNAEFLKISFITTNQH
jgi:hypothetical protein